MPRAAGGTGADLGHRGRRRRGGLRRRGRVRRPGGGRGRRAGAGARPVRRRRGHRPVRRGRVRRRRHAASSTRRASATRRRRCSRYLSAEVGDAVSAGDAARSSATAARRCSPGWRATACRSRAACARTRPRIRPTATTSTTPAASCRPPASRRPAPRGHRARGPRDLGRLLFARLAAAVRGSRRPVDAADQRAAADHRRRRAGDRGRSAARCADAPAWARTAHRRAAPLVGASRTCTRRKARPGHAPAGRLAGAPVRPPAAGRARPGVVLAAGGFVANRAMMREHAPGRPRRAAAGHARRRRQRDPAGHAGRRGHRVPGPRLGLAVPHRRRLPCIRGILVGPGRDADLR